LFKKTKKTQKKPKKTKKKNKKTKKNQKKTEKNEKNQKKRKNNKNNKKKPCGTLVGSFLVACSGYGVCFQTPNQDPTQNKKTDNLKTKQENQPRLRRCTKCAVSNTRNFMTTLLPLS